MISSPPVSLRTLLGALAAFAALAAHAGPPPSPTALDTYYSSLESEKKITPERARELYKKHMAPAENEARGDFYRQIYERQKETRKTMEEESLKWKIRYAKEKIRQKYLQPFTVTPSGRPPVTIDPANAPAVTQGRKGKTASPRPPPSARPQASASPQAGRKKVASPAPAAPETRREEVILDGSKVPAEVSFSKGDDGPVQTAPEPSPSPGTAISGTPGIDELNFSKRPAPDGSPAVASPKARR